MLGTVARNTSLFSIALIGSIIVCAALLTPPVAAQTAVQATICQSEATVTLNAPVSDSTVTTPTVTVSGTVIQASQIEVYIDGQIDSIVPLNLGQTTFETDLTLSPGTRTIKVVAVDVCQVANGEATVVVTYTPPPATPSTGNATTTNVGDGSGQAGVRIGSGAERLQAEVEQQNPLLFKLFVDPFKAAADWLNINTDDVGGPGQRLSVWRAVVLGIGFYLAILGMANSVINALLRLSFIAAVLPGSTARVRTKRLRWLFRLLGVLLICGALFL